MTETIPRRVVHSIAVWPTTAVYLSAVGVIACITSGLITPAAGVIALTILAIFVVLMAVRYETHTVYALMSRNEQLIDLLHLHKIPVPPPLSKETHEHG